MIEAYWKARRSRPELSTGRPSSENPTAPASASDASSASCAPSWPREMAPRNPTATTASLGRALVQRLHDRGGVDHRVGVRHREDRPETAGSSCGRTRRDVLLVLLPGCSEVDVRIDEGREQREPVGIHDLGVIRRDEIVSECRR